MTAYGVVNSKTCSCQRAKIKPPYIQISAKSIVGQKTAKPLHILLGNISTFILMSKLQNADHQTAIQASYNDVLYIHTGFAAIMSSAFLTKLFLCPQRNCGRHIVIVLSIPPSVCPSVRPSRFLSGAYLRYSLR